MTETATIAETREWLIRKGSYYYRPNFSGYTTRKLEAGRYTKEEAESEAAVEPWHMKAIHQDEIPDEPEVVDLRAEITRLTAALETAEREREEARAADDAAMEYVDNMRAALDEKDAELARLKQAVAEEREACAKVADDQSYRDTNSDYDHGYIQATDDIAKAIRARSEEATDAR